MERPQLDYEPPKRKAIDRKKTGRRLAFWVMIVVVVGLLFNLTQGLVSYFKSSARLAPIVASQAKYERDRPVFIRPAPAGLPDHGPGFVWKTRTDIVDGEPVEVAYRTDPDNSKPGRWCVYAGPLLSHDGREYAVRVWLLDNGSDAPDTLQMDPVGTLSLQDALMPDDSRPTGPTTFVAPLDAAAPVTVFEGKLSADRRGVVVRARGHEDGKEVQHTKTLYLQGSAFGRKPVTTMSE